MTSADPAGSANPTPVQEGTDEGGAMEEEAGDAAPAQAYHHRSRSQLWRGAALLVVLVAAAAAGLWGLSRGTSDADPLDDAREVARAFGSAYLSFEASSVEEVSNRLLDMGTDDFVREFRAARLPSVEELFSSGDVSTLAEVTDVFTTGIDDRRVRALVFVDVEARGPEGEQRLTNLSFVLELESVDDRWLVDAVAPVPIPEVVGAGGPTTSSPSATSEPAPAPSADG